MSVLSPVAKVTPGAQGDLEMPFTKPCLRRSFWEEVLGQKLTLANKLLKWSAQTIE